MIIYYPINVGPSGFIPTDVSIYLSNPTGIRSLSFQLFGPSRIPIQFSVRTLEHRLKHYYDGNETFIFHWLLISFVFVLLLAFQLLTVRFCVLQ